MDEQQQIDHEAGEELYHRGWPISACENPDQEWGWLVAREDAEGIPAQ